MRRLGLLTAVFAAGSALAADGVSVGGFADAHWDWTKSGSASSTNTFSVYDGAVYLNGSMAGAKAMVDVPFSLTDATSNTMTLGMKKAQAWIEHMYDNGFHWKMGQFDSIHGSEGKDTADIPFSHHSMITAENMPWTHTGLLAGYMINEDWDLDVMIANPDSLSGMTKGNPDFGVRLKGNFKDMGIDEFTGSFTMGRTVSTTANNNAKHWLASGILGLHFGDIIMRGDGFMFNSGVTGAKTSMGIGGYTQFNMSDTLAAGVRFGLGSNRAVTEHKFQLTVGPQYKATKNMTMKVDYTLGMMADKPTNTKKHLISVASVYKF